MKIKFDFKMDKSFDAKILKAINKGVEAGTIEVERRAKANCPVVTSNLKNNIFREVIGTIGKVYTSVEYAPYVEFGTKHFKGRFFMRRALYENWMKIQNLINRVFKASLG